MTIDYTKSVEYVGRTIVPSELPESSFYALMRRGLASWLGNETSAKASAEIAKVGEANGEPLADDEKKAIRAFLVDEAFAKVLSGEMKAIRARGGSTIDPLEAEIAKIAKAEVVNTLRAHKLWVGAKLPKAEDSFTFANGESQTLEELLVRYRKRHEAKLTKDAKARLEAEAKKLAKAEAEAARLGDGEVGAEDLGF